MIAAKDMYFVQPRYERNSLMPTTLGDMICFIIAVLSILVSIYYFLLDIGTIMFMFQSGQIVMAIGFLFVGIIKHVCQVMWVIKFFVTIQLVVDFGMYICLGALLILGGCLAVFIVFLLGEQKTWIEVLMHPFVLEYGVFFIANIFMILHFLKIIKNNYGMSGFNYAAVPQTKPFVMPQNNPYVFSLYP